MYKTNKNVTKLDYARPYYRKRKRNLTYLQYRTNKVILEQEFSIVWNISIQGSILYTSFPQAVLSLFLQIKCFHMVETKSFCLIIYYFENDVIFIKNNNIFMPVYFKKQIATGVANESRGSLLAQNYYWNKMSHHRNYLTANATMPPIPDFKNLSLVIFIQNEISRL